MRAGGAQRRRKKKDWGRNFWQVLDGEQLAAPNQSVDGALRRRSRRCVSGIMSRSAAAVPQPR